MRCSVFCILVLAISEPLLAYANKVVVVIPQQIKRSHMPSWRPSPSRYKKASHGNDFYYRKYHGHYHGKKPVYHSPPFPHGGDDFDQGYKNVNHVNVPYGKGTSHAITFGKGYIPYDRIKGSLSITHDRFPEAPKDHKPQSPEPNYASTSYSTNFEYPSSGYESSQPDTYFSNPESALNYDRRTDLKKLYTTRSIEKDLTANVDLGAILDQGKESIIFTQQKSPESYNIPQQVQGNVVLPSGIPSITIGGSKEGIVLRDSVSLDEYQQKLAELTKSWPQFTVNGGGAVNGYQNQVTSFPAGQSGTGFTGSINWPLSFAQPKQGYAVKEDTNEPPHDFRTMPIQTSPVQTIPVQVNAALSPLVQTVHG